MWTMDRERQIYNVTLIGSAGNVLLVIAKFIAGILGHSSAMIADAVHSLSDFVTDIVVLIFVGISARPQDPTHDYGHGKFETLASLLISLALVAAAIGIIVSGALKFASWLKGEDLTPPGTLALWVAILSIAVKETMYQYTAFKGRKLSSTALTANAWHHRSDALSSIGAAIGIGGAILLGGRWAVLDPLASIVVGAMLLGVNPFPKRRKRISSTSSTPATEYQNLTTCAPAESATAWPSKPTSGWTGPCRFQRLTISLRTSSAV